MASVDSRRMGNGGGVGGTFQPYLDSLRQELQESDRTLLSVVVALLAVLLTLVFWKFIRSRRSSQRAVLLVGLCDSGKTLLFVRLLTGLYRDTQTSITDSSAVYRVNNTRGASLTLIDLPGHESLRLQFLERFKASARAVVFVVDSAAFQREVKDVAEFLYQVLIDSMGLKNTPSFLIACNKQATLYESPVLLPPAHWTVPALPLLSWERKAKNLNSHSCPSKWSSWSAVPRVEEETLALLTSRTWRSGWLKSPEQLVQAQDRDVCVSDCQFWKRVWSPAVDKEGV
uniref:Signal recognition particle receptor subunit beta n=1 Tax=Equus caballus TaxID=9796 RepID=A0A9L0TJ62_HORSE